MSVTLIASPEVIKMNRAAGKVKIIPPGLVICSKRREEIYCLFDTYYYRYHYMDELLAANKYKFLYIFDDKVVGYCTLNNKYNFAICSNLLVSEDFRGSGIGKELEKARQIIISTNRWYAYASCTTTSLASQCLKAQYRLIPINVKYGYRFSVFQANKWTSAICYVYSGSLYFDRQCFEKTICGNILSENVLK